MESAPLAVPAMALPITGKNDFCWPDEQLTRLNEQRGKVSRLVTIGWRGLEEHFTPLLRPLVKSHAKALVVTGGSDGESEANEVRIRLQSTTDCGLPHWETYSSGFTSLIEDHRLNRFLSLP